MMGSEGLLLWRSLGRHGRWTAAACDWAAAGESARMALWCSLQGGLYPAASSQEAVDILVFIVLQGARCLRDPLSMPRTVGPS